MDGGPVPSGGGIVSIRDHLRRLIDQLPDAETLAALRYLEYLRDRHGEDPLLRALEAAPIDDEPLTSGEEAALAEASAQVQRGEVVAWEDLKKQLRDCDQ